MIIKTYDRKDKQKRFECNGHNSHLKSSNKTFKTISSDFEETVKKYENVLLEVKTKKSRPQTAHRFKKKKPNIHLANSFVAPVIDSLRSPIHNSLYLTRKNSYERLFDRPEMKTDIQIVGRNIKDCIKDLEENAINKDLPLNLAA